MKSRKIEQNREMEDIISRCEVCYVAMNGRSGEPYVVPMNFGYEEGFLYLHSAPEGKKIDLLKNDGRICAVFSTDHLLRYQHEKVACSYSMKYRSVLLYGTVEFVENSDEKTRIMNIIMKHYVKGNFTYSEPAIKNVETMRIKAERMEGKAYGF